MGTVETGGWFDVFRALNWKQVIFNRCWGGLDELQIERNPIGRKLQEEGIRVVDRRCKYLESRKWPLGSKV